MFINEAQVCTWCWVINGVDDFVFSCHNNLVDRCESLVVHGLGWVCPSNYRLLCQFASLCCCNIGWSLDCVLIDSCWNIVEDGCCALVVIDSVDCIPVVVRAAPSEVEADEVILIIAVSDESVAAF